MTGSSLLHGPKNLNHKSNNYLKNCFWSKFWKRQQTNPEFLFSKLIIQLLILFLIQGNSFICIIRVGEEIVVGGGELPITSNH